MLYASLIEEHLKEQGPILSDRERAYTYSELHWEVMDKLEYFYRQGAREGDRILIRSHNDVRTVEAVLACIAGGFIFVLASDLCSKKELDDMMKDCSPSIIFENYESENKCREKFRTIERRRISESAGAYILYTSGSTGDKKGVFACHKQIAFCCKAILSRINYKESDKVLCALPLEFDYGLYQIFLSLLSKTQVFLVEADIIQMIPRYLQQWEITIYPTIPSVMNFLLKLGFWDRVKMPCLRCITFTGEVLTVKLIEELKKVLPFVNVIPMYGITECKRVAIMPQDREDKVMAGSCGLPLDEVKVYLKKEEPTEKIGELIVEGPNVMEGYWNCEDSRFGINPKTGMKTYRTGDLLSMDEEGYLYFHGRCNGLMKIRGRRISEAEIENVVLGIADVRECAVIEIQDGLYGTRIGVCIYAKDENVKKDVEKALERKTTLSGLYRTFWFPEPFPKNRNGKIDRIELGKMVDEKK